MPRSCGSRGTVLNRFDAASCNQGTIGFPRARLTVVLRLLGWGADGDDTNRDVVPLDDGADVLHEAWPDAGFPEPGGDRAGQAGA
jgi:hypothetical protein